LSDFDPSAYLIAQPVYAFTTARSSTGSSAAGTARLSQPQLPDTSLILTAASKRMFLASIHGPCGSFDSGFSGPHGVLIDSLRQRLLVADRLAHRVVALDRNSLDKVWQHGVSGEGGSGFANLFYPHAIALSASQTMLCAC
jgi:DNA-binding beta-propeller fold protein YncE